MRKNDLLPMKIKEAIDEFFNRTNKVTKNAVQIIANDFYTIPRIPRRIGSYEFPYFYAAVLDEMFRYALGGFEASPKFIEKVCKEVESVLFTAPMGSLPIDQSFYSDHPLGFGIYLARTRIKLRTDLPLSFDEIVSITDVDLDILNEKLSKIPKQNDLYPAEEVKKLFEELNQRI